MLDRLKKLLEPEVSLNAKLIGVSLFFGKAFESITDRLVSLESRQLQKGDKGDRGESIVGPKGDKGDKGDPGVAGQSIVGPAGPVGKAGKAGRDGVSVVDAEIAADSHLVLKLSSGAIIDAGELPIADSNGRVFVSGNAYQITVSATAPENPQLNQLWLDIS